MHNCQRANTGLKGTCAEISCVGNPGPRRLEPKGPSLSVRILYGAKFQLNRPVERLNSVVGAIIFAKQELLLARKYDRPSWRPDPVRFFTPSADEVALRWTNGSLLPGHTRMEPTHWLSSGMSPSVGPTQPWQPLNTTIPHHLLSSNCNSKIQSIES